MYIFLNEPYTENLYTSKPVLSNIYDCTTFTDSTKEKSIRPENKLRVNVFIWAIAPHKAWYQWLSIRPSLNHILATLFRIIPSGCNPEECGWWVVLFWIYGQILTWRQPIHLLFIFSGIRVTYFLPFGRPLAPQKVMTSPRI